MATSEHVNHEEPDSFNQVFTLYALDKLGYSKSLSENRVKTYKILSECGTEIIRQLRHEDTDIIIAGSRGEGICIACDSDADILFIQRNVKCTENIQTALRLDRNIPVIFQLDFENVPHGYSKLRLLSFDSWHNVPRNNFKFLKNLKGALVQRNCQKFLRNDIPLATALAQNRLGWVKQQSVFQDITGPARTFRADVFMPEISLLADCVLAFSCEYPSVTDDWSKRERKNSWPDKDLIERVKKLDVLVVPAGCKGSTDEELQWRISLTLAEHVLIHSFNDIQIKLYAALKMLAKHELKPICENITSYIIKNLIFWTFENNEIKDIRKDIFDVTLIKILEHLKFCITWKYMPNYMIPSKNMLQYKVSENEKVKLIERLSLIIYDGRNVLIRCPVVKQILYLSSEELEEMIAIRELVEQSISALLFISSVHPELSSKIWEYYHPSENVFKIIVDEVFPIIGMYNPAGLFDRLTLIRKETFYRCLVNGINRGYFK